jgi:hypothetical protein
MAKLSVVTTSVSPFNNLMLQRNREWLAILLISLLPLHALFVTFFTKLVSGAGNAPLPVLALWKEVLLVSILAIAFAEVWNSEEKERTELLKPDRLDTCIVFLLVLSLVITALTHGNWKMYLFGFKYDFIPLIAFIVLRRVSWSEWCSVTLVKVVLGVGGIVAFYGLVTLLLPMQFFQALGYSDLHSLYLPGGPLAAFQQIGDSGVRRIQSTFSGPNQFGLWLLLPWSFGIVAFFSAWFRAEFPLLRFGTQRTRSQQCTYSLLYLALIGGALLFTFSRTAWLAAIAVTAVFILKTLPERRATKNLVRLLGVGGMIIILLAISAPSTVVRLASSRDHLLKPLAAIGSIASHPLGQGIGTAGPASNRFSDACVFLAPESDPAWAADRQELCVFVGGEQVQPLERTCNCPFVTENWYLQMGVEMGVLGLIVYVAFTVLVLMNLAATSAIFLPFLGISVAGLLLHSWEGSAVAYTLWLLVATSLPVRK